MPRCENWKKQNDAFEKANAPAEQSDRDVKCARCQREFHPGLLRITPAPHLGRNRAWVVCSGCNGSR